MQSILALTALVAAVSAQTTVAAVPAGLSDTCTAQEAVLAKIFTDCKVDLMAIVAQAPAIPTFTKDQVTCFCSPASVDTMKKAAAACTGPNDKPVATMITTLQGSCVVPTTKSGSETLGYAAAAAAVGAMFL
ncbi:hypothetical protein HDU79_011958 [Rhizoclosmatium sp. JEL0117]|nr:hypothetical protein HDU79_011958 [Rhizoclosmatium sp. JEL0117]